MPEEEPSSYAGFCEDCSAESSNDKNVPQADGAWNFHQKLQICFGKALAPQGSRFPDRSTFKALSLSVLA